MSSTDFSSAVIGLLWGGVCSIVFFLILVFLGRKKNFSGTWLSIGTEDGGSYATLSASLWEEAFSTFPGRGDCSYLQYFNGAVRRVGGSSFSSFLSMGCQNSDSVTGSGVFWRAIWWSFVSFCVFLEGRIWQDNRFIYSTNSEVSYPLWQPLFVAPQKGECRGLLQTLGRMVLSLKYCAYFSMSFFSYSYGDFYFSLQEDNVASDITSVWLSKLG